jgi:hypothetical protein
MPQVQSGISQGQPEIRQKQVEQIRQIEEKVDFFMLL